MVKVISEGAFVRYKIFKGYRVLSGCLFCHGALLPGVIPPVDDGIDVFKCFHCGRMFLKSNGRIRLWPYRKYDHLSVL